MARAKVVVTPVRPGDAAAIAPVWDDLLRSYDPGPTPGGASVLHRARARWEVSGDDDRHRTLVAWVDDEPVGLAALSVVEVGPWSGTVVLISLLHVVDRARRRGVGHALLLDALALADLIGADQVAVDVPPHLRDVNRYFARLGFGPVVTRRVATTAALRRRLLGDGAPRGRLASLRARGRRGGGRVPQPRPEGATGAQDEVLPESSAALEAEPTTPAAAAPTPDKASDDRPTEVADRVPVDS